MTTSAIVRNVEYPHLKGFTLPGLIILHLLPGALLMLLMLLLAPQLKFIGLLPSLPVLFVFVAPLLVLGMLGFLYFKGRQYNGRLSLRGIVLYRDKPVNWWQTIGIAMLLFTWLAFIWYVCKPALNRFFITNFFSWMPNYLFDEQFMKNLSMYTPTTLRILGVLFAISISLGGVVEELYFRGYLLPRMEFLGGWAPTINILLFSLYHFWSPWENLARLLAMTPWIFAIWRTRNIYLALLVHFVINTFSGISLLVMIW